jgi:hypothetical protein
MRALSLFPCFLKNKTCQVGFFDLDPNRVLSLVLDAYECDPTNGAFLTLIEQFKKAYLPQVLGFKFQFYAAPAAAAAADTGNADAATQLPPRVNGPAPPSLYRLAASLLARRLVQLDDVLPHLSPSVADCARLDAARSAALAAAAQAVGKVNLSDTAQQAAERKAAGGSGSGDGIPSFDDAGGSGGGGGGGGGAGKSSGGGVEEGEEEGDSGGGRGVAGSNQVCVRALR